MNTFDSQIESHIENTEKAGMDEQEETSIDEKYKVDLSRTYTFGEMLLEKASTPENEIVEEKENLLYSHLPKKFDVFKEQKEISTYQIKVFSIKEPAIKPHNHSIIKEGDLKPKKDPKEKLINKLYMKLLQSKNCESLNCLKVFFDEELSNILLNMDQHYSKMLTDIIFKKFNLLDYLKIFKSVFMFEKEGIFENFIKLLVNKGVKLNNNFTAKLNHAFKDAIGKIKNANIKNIADLFSIYFDPIDDILKTCSMGGHGIVFKAEYPLDLIFDKEVLYLFNKIFKFILEMKKAKYLLVAENVSLKKIKKANLEDSFLRSDKSISDDDEDKEDENMRNLIENTEKIKEFNLLKKQFCFNQRELLHFINNLEFFIGYSVIEEYYSKHIQQIAQLDKITEISYTLREFLSKVADICMVNDKKTENLFKLLRQVFDCCSDFYDLYTRMDQASPHDDNYLIELEKIKVEIQNLMKGFRASIRLIMKILNEYNQKGTMMLSKYQ